MSQVVFIKSKDSPTKSSGYGPDKIIRMVQRGIMLSTGSNTPQDAFLALFRKGEKIGVKINTIAGKKMTTHPDLSLSLAGLLAKHCTPEENIIIWDRTNQELRRAGYSLNLNRRGFKVFGTDTEGIGYGQDLRPHLNTGSRFSAIQENFITSSISLAVLKDHGMAGVTAGMKNYFGAIHNPNKYHDFNCDPFVAEIFDHRLIKSKHRLSILDAMTVQYHRGPAYHATWAENQYSLIFSLDPVAADVVGWDMIEGIRARKGLPSLQEEKRQPGYLTTAGKMGLGQSDLNKIQVIEEEI